VESANTNISDSNFSILSTALPNKLDIILTTLIFLLALKLMTCIVLDVVLVTDSIIM